jgi:acyl-CoA reductase-like NAD-dependent aldehyde dehydrogenase
MADKAGAEIQTILKNYGVEGGTTIGDISADRQKALGLELGGKAKTSTAELAPTQEAVRNLVERDIIQNTGDAKAADSLATLYSGKYDSRENILKQEQNLTEARNDEIERRKKDLTRTLKLDNTLSKGATRTKAPKVNTLHDDYRILEILG